MGWTFTNREKGLSHKEFFGREFGGNGYEVIDSAAGGLNKSNVYLAVKHPRGYIYAVCCLTKWVPKSYFNFGYKNMNESMGPFISDCPERLFDILSPVEDTDHDGRFSVEDAKVWRDRVREYHEKLKNKIKLKDGIKVCVPYELDFGEWRLDKDEPFYVENAKRKIFIDQWRRRFKLRRDTMFDLQLVQQEETCS